MAHRPWHGCQLRFSGFYLETIVKTGVSFIDRIGPRRLITGTTAVGNVRIDFHAAVNLPLDYRVTMFHLRVVGMSSSLSAAGVCS